MKCRLLARDAAAASGRPRFAAANHRLDHLHFRAVDLAGLLVSQELLDVSFELGGSLRRHIEVLVELRRELGVADRIVVEHRDVAGRLIGDVHLVALIDQPDQRAAHRDHVIIRVRREHHHTLGEDVDHVRNCGRPVAWHAPVCLPASR